MWAGRERMVRKTAVRSRAGKGRMDIMTKSVLKKKRIGVLMGGISAERDVSLRSGMAVYKALQSRHYNVTAIDAKDDLCAVLKKKKIEMAFVVLHGGYGENGGVQGLLEVMGIPYTGSGILASAVAMDKEASKKLFLYHDIPVPPFTIVHRPEFTSRRSKKAGSAAPGFRAGFPLPWVVKPATEGSSVGVGIVKEKSRMKDALNLAFRYGERVIVEQYIAGKEVQIGILNDTVLGGVEVVPSLEFYSYEAKYTPGLTEYILPPRLHNRLYEKAQSTALAAHRALGCSGATRVDLIIDDRGNSYVLEVNTIPGMTATSLLPKIAQQAGYAFPDLLEEILRGVGEG